MIVLWYGTEVIKASASVLAEEYSSLIFSGKLDFSRLDNSFHVLIEESPLSSEPVKYDSSPCFKVSP